MMLADTVVAHYRELVDFLSRRTGSRESAQDCAQEAWIKLATSHTLKAPIDNLRAYVFQVAANLAIDFQRQHAAEQRKQALYAQSRLPDCTAPDTLDTASLRQTIARLEAAIMSQPLRTRQIFLMHKIDGDSYTDIALALAVSVKTVEKHMTRALLACRLAVADA